LEIHRLSTIRGKYLISFPSAAMVVPDGERTSSSRLRWLAAAVHLED